MTDALETTELLDVDVDHLAGMLALVAADRLGRFDIPEPRQSGTLENAANGGGRDADSGGDLLARHALATQACDAFDHIGRRRLAQPMRPRAAILQAGRALLLEATGPFAARARANACGFTGGLRRLPTQDHFGARPELLWRDVLRHLPARKTPGSRNEVVERNKRKTPRRRSR